MFDFITADWHLGETRMSIMDRPFSHCVDMANELLANHNKVVMPEDKVLFVGDAVCRVAEDRLFWLEYINQFNGIKTIIRGNHERGFEKSQLLTVFDTVIPEGDGIQFDIEDKEKGRIIPCYATHYPTRSVADRFNLVGHIHTAWKNQKNMLNVGVDVHHFRPLPISRIPFYLGAVEGFYDDDVWVANHPANAPYAESRGKKGSYLDVVS